LRRRSKGCWNGQAQDRTAVGRDVGDRRAVAAVQGVKDSKTIAGRIRTVGEIGLAEPKVQIPDWEASVVGFIGWEEHRHGRFVVGHRQGDVGESRTGDASLGNTVDHPIGEIITAALAVRHIGC